MSRPIFFVRRGDRLVARLKHLFYAWRFAKQVDGRVIMHWSDELPEYWQQFDGPMYSASLVFDLQGFYAKGGADSLVFMGERLGTAERRWESEGASLSGPNYAPYRFNRFPRDLFKQPGLVFYETSAMRYQLEDERKSPAEISSELRSLFDELAPTPYIQRALDQVRGKLGDSTYVGLHVRRGDTYDRLRGEFPGFLDGSTPVERIQYLLSHYVTRTSPQALYEPHVERALAEGKAIAYFSDSPASIDGFRRTFKGADIIDMSKFKMRAPIQKAYLDFVMLSKSEKIISTRSNYASFGAQLTGADYVIVSDEHKSAADIEYQVDRYYETAIKEFLPKGRLSSTQTAIVRKVISDTLCRTQSTPFVAQPESARDTQSPVGERPSRDMKSSILSRLGMGRRSNQSSNTGQA